MNQPPSNEFAVVAIGANFDPDHYTSTSPLPITHRWRRGGARVGTPVASEWGGLCIELGYGPELPIQDQQEIATAFLEANERALLELGALPAVDSFYLGLQEEVLRATLGSIFDLHPPLMRIVLKIGIQLTVWACLEQGPTSPISN